MIPASTRATMNLNKPVIEPQLILEIDGLPVLCARKLYIMPKLGTPGLKLGMPGLKLGRPFEDKSALKLIDISGSTTQINQQIFQDKGIASSNSSLGIQIVDKDQLITKWISPGVEVDDILSRKAIVYLNHGNGTHPEDSQPILYGIVDTIDAGAGVVKLNIAHPEGLKRQEIYTQIQAKLTSRFRYRSKIIQGINYQTQDDVTGAMPTIQINSGGTKGSETVTVIGNAIVITANTSFVAGTGSVASDIVSAIKKSQAAVNVVKVETTDGNDNLLITTQAATALVTDTQIDLDSTEGIFTQTTDGTFLTYVKIADEILQYTGITGNSLTGVSSAQFATIGKTYEIGEDVETFYRIQGNMSEIALKLMLSRGAAIESVALNHFRYLDGVTDIPNALIWATIDLQKKYGITVGDYVSSSGSSNPTNDFTDRKIMSITRTDSGSYIIVDGAALTLEENSPALISFKSKYDVWPDGIGLSIDQVDVARHEDLIAFNPADFHEMDFYLKDTIQADDFIANQLYFTNGCYTIPREGRCSVGKTLPPLMQSNTKTFDEKNVINASGIRIVRSKNQYFYNSVVYKFEEDAVEDDFTQNVVRLSQASFDRVKNVKNIPMVIEASGVRDNPDSREKITTLQKRVLDRYQFGAEVLDVKVKYKDGYDCEVGDTVIFGSEALQISDSTIGSRAFRPRVMEIINAKKDFGKGDITLTLLSTAYTADANYGVLSPSSFVDIGATTSHLRLKKSITTPDSQLEQYKWVNYIGQKVLVHSKDWSFQEETTFFGFVTSDPDVMILNPPLSTAPGENYVIDIPYYPTSTNQDDNAIYKAIHVFACPHVQVVAQPAADKVEVSAGDIEKFHVNSPVRIHTEDYSSDTGDIPLKVKSISGNVLTLTASLSIVLDNTFYIDLIGFPDLRGPYRIL